MHAFYRQQQQKKCGFIWLNITHIYDYVCWSPLVLWGSMWDVVHHTKLPIAWPKQFCSFHNVTAILFVCILLWHVWLFLIIMIVASSVYFFFFSLHTLVSTVACSLACASWIFQHGNSLSITEIYITTQVSDIYGSFCAILCLFLYLLSVCCFALYLWLYGIKKNWTVLFSENTDCLGL